MVNATMSLERRAFYRILALFLFAFAVASAASFIAFDAREKNELQSSLVLKKQIVEETFESYLSRAEHEMNFISQDLLLGNYVPSKALDMLFGHHDLLFFGGLDFFYIDWENRPPAVDPRARLYTKDDIAPLLRQGKINRWVKVTSKDGAIFLLYKKKLVGKGGVNVGYLYGFVSLNENLTLASKLLDAAKVDMVLIKDASTGAILLKEKRNSLDVSDNSVQFTSAFSSSVYDSHFELEVVSKSVISFRSLYHWGQFVFWLFIGLTILFALLAMLVRRLVFSPLAFVVGRTSEEFLPFSELQPLQAQGDQYRQFLQAKERRFQLLLDSTNNAVIFCNEVACVDAMNKEAKRLFPNNHHSRSVFDFTPISVHQAIQDALKGEVGVSFELTLPHLNVIYHWCAYSFTNENGFRSLLLVGRDMTNEKRLSWQLEQLRPSTLQLHRHIDIEVLLKELSLLSRWPDNISSQYFRGWLATLLELLDDLKSEEAQIEDLPIGELLARESEWLTSRLGVAPYDVRIDCPVGVGSMVVSCDINLRNLLRVLLVLVTSNDASERQLSLRSDVELEMVVISEAELRPFWHWMINALLQPLAGRQRQLRNNAFKVELPLAIKGTEPGNEKESFTVAWVWNDYLETERIKDSLERLGGQVESYSSTDAFFMQASSVTLFDVVIIGSDHDVQAPLHMIKALKGQQDREELPIIWLSTQSNDLLEYGVLGLSGCVFDYCLQKVIANARQYEGIIPMHMGGRKRAWIVVGGSRVAKAIWYTELERLSISSQWLAGLEEFEAIFPYHSDAVVVLLEPQLKGLLTSVGQRFPSIRFYAVQNWPDMVDNVHFYEMQLPYTGEQICALRDYVQSTTDLGAENE
ncbi:hypothetical protein MSP8887_02550 [Marinomonas spartinae]|uniref:Uncharacterized protein n=1 Tax=Marinomonas spartinae TaxID=1792290 RepID=A0A1A8SZE1_9GAMM|nr:hypothetical protein [Marinomonas spartinae]SBS24556.1 hypothetical protein MSP8886_00008 [Marinomonas spartinae]SBS36189.1 hypothetical protein MSP8887_02550 [Marinomonas spartinae]